MLLCCFIAYITCSNAISAGNVLNKMRLRSTSSSNTVVIASGRIRWPRENNLTAWSTNSQRSILLENNQIDKDTNRKKYIITLIGLSYLGIIVSAMTLPCSLSLVDKSIFGVNSISSPVATLTMSQVFFMATYGTVAGKFLLGPPTDSLGGHAVLMLSLAINAVLLFYISTTTSQISFAIAWLILSFIYGATWGAVGAVVRRDFPQKDWSTQLGLAAAFSRFGSLSSSVVFGAVIKYTHGSWRAVFRFASVLQAMLFVVYLALGSKVKSVSTLSSMSSTTSSSTSLFKSFTDKLSSLLLIESQTKELSSISNNNDDKSNNANNSNNNNILSNQQSDIKNNVSPDMIKESSSALLYRVSKSSTFWGMLLSKACLLGVGQMIAFFSLYLETGLGMSAGSASSWSGLFALGSFIASLVGSRYYQSFSETKRRRLVTTSNFIGVVIPLLLCAHANKVTAISSLLSVRAILFLLTLWGIAWAMAFYIPAGVIALELGGKHHAALITNLADGVGFAVAAVFSVFAMDRGRRGGSDWSAIMLTLASFAGIALVSLRHAMKSVSLSHEQTGHNKCA